MTSAPGPETVDGPVVALYKTGTEHVVATFILHVGGVVTLKIFDHAYDVQTRSLGRGVWSDVTRESVLPRDGDAFLHAVTDALTPDDEAGYGLYAVYLLDGMTAYICG